MNLGKVLKRLMNYCPDKMQEYFVRKMVTLPETVPSRYNFKIAQTQQELEASFRLVYDAYLKLGYCVPNSHKMRATVYHALPTTATLIALDGDTVIGTLTIVRDNILKLPLEKKFDIENLRRKANRPAEITSLVIHPDYRREKGGLILFPLLKYMYEYSTKYFGVDHLVITIHPKDEFFYRSLLRFKRIPGTGVEEYLDAPAIALHLNLQNAAQEYFKSYNDYPAPKNLHDFFTTKKIQNLIYPNRKFYLISDPFITPDFYEDLFLNKLGMGTEIVELFNCALKNKEMHVRESERVEVDLTCIFSIPFDESISHIGKIKDVSSNGFRLFTNEGLPTNIDFTCKIKIHSDQFATVVARIVWKNEDRGYGLKIQQADQNWNDYISYLYQIQMNKIG